MQHVRKSENRMSFSGEVKEELSRASWEKPSLSDRGAGGADRI